jgi:hypothetical protein
MKRTPRGGGFEFTSVTKALTFPNTLLNEISNSQFDGCATGSSGPSLLESVEEVEGERIEISLGDVSLVSDYP